MAPMIVEGGKGTIDAIKASVEVTKRDWIMFTLFAIALGLIAGAGGIACGVGVLATYPLLFLGHALAYRDLVGMPGAQSQDSLCRRLLPPDYRDYAPAQTPRAAAIAGRAAADLCGSSRSPNRRPRLARIAARTWLAR